LEAAKISNDDDASSTTERISFFPGSKDQNHIPSWVKLDLPLTHTSCGRITASVPKTILAPIRDGAPKLLATATVAELSQRLRESAEATQTVPKGQKLADSTSTLNRKDLQEKVRIGARYESILRADIAGKFVINPLPRDPEKREALLDETHDRVAKT